MIKKEVQNDAALPKNWNDYCPVDVDGNLYACRVASVIFIICPLYMDMSLVKQLVDNIRRRCSSAVDY